MQCMFWTLLDQEAKYEARGRDSMLHSTTLQSPCFSGNTSLSPILLLSHGPVTHIAGPSLRLAFDSKTLPFRDMHEHRISPELSILMIILIMDQQQPMQLENTTTCCHFQAPSIQRHWVKFDIHDVRSHDVYRAHLPL